MAMAVKCSVHGFNYPQSDTPIADNGRMKKVDIRQVFARNLEEKRKELRLSQTDLAVRAGTSQGHVSEILNCLVPPGIDLAADLAYAVKCEPWELFVDTAATKENILAKLLGREAPPPPVEPPRKAVAAKRKRKPPAKKGNDPQPEAGGGAE